MNTKNCSVVVRKVLHDDKWVTAEVTDVEFDSGKKIFNFLRVTIKDGGSVTVCARLVDGRFILVRQCRPVAGLSVEFVAGSREQDESWEEAAVREMIQETGYMPGRLVHIGDFYGQTDRIDNKHHFFLAFDCVGAEKKLDGDEIQEIERLVCTLEQVLEMIKSGEIKDMPTIAGIFALLCYQGNIGGLKQIFNASEVSKR